MAGPHPDAATWRKLGVKDGHRLVLVRAPAGWTTDGLGVTATVATRRTRTPADVLVAFYRSRAALATEAPRLGAAIARDGMVWVAWPRKAAGHVSDLSDQVVRGELVGHGLVDVKVAMLDEDWLGLKFVWRAALR